MRVYHFVNREFGLQDLKLQRLKVAQIEDLNDPFELRALGANIPAMRAAMETMRTELALKRGMLCFSKDWRNPVQWSHYSERHRGLALGFEIPDELLTPIIYSSERIEPDIEVLRRKDEDAFPLMKRALTTKYSHWRYEKELRVHVDLSDRDASTGLFFVEFSDELHLKEVIVGACSTITRAELRAALGPLENQVSSWKARLAFGSFRIVRQRDQRLWD
jgi:Protein of unknown function (DUF2971)